MFNKLYYFGFFLLMGGNLINSKKTSSNRYEDMEEFDPVLVTRCDLICNDKSSASEAECHNRCLKSKTSKLGTCPIMVEGLPPFIMACLKACTHDSQCPNTEKCCSHSCGVTCQPAMDLDIVDGLMPVPFNVTAQENDSNSVHVQWSLPPYHLKTDILFLIESRNHFGKYYNKESLGPWMPIHQSAETSAILFSSSILAGRWYVFRVAAVNANGTRGFSKPSPPFALSRLPSKPGMPKRLRVTNIREINGTIWADLKWGRPKTVIPLRRYKVFWSRRLPGFSASGANNSVMVEQRSVPKSQQHFLLKNLIKNDYYYIQVQAVAVFERNKLKGEKAELFFNTSVLFDQKMVPIRKRRPQKLY